MCSSVYLIYLIFFIDLSLSYNFYFLCIYISIRDVNMYNEQDFSLTEMEKELYISERQLELFKKDFGKIEKELTSVNKIERDIDSWLKHLKETVKIDNSDNQTLIIENDEAVHERFIFIFIFTFTFFMLFK